LVFFGKFSKENVKKRYPIRDNDQKIKPAFGQALKNI
jgi:hypothetical protein